MNQIYILFLKYVLQYIFNYFFEVTIQYNETYLQLFHIVFLKTKFHFFSWKEFIFDQ